MAVLYTNLLLVKNRFIYFPPLFQLMQADPQKLDFRNDLMPRLPGPGGIGGIGGLGPLGGPLPPTHDLSRPGSLFAAASKFLFHTAVR